MYQEFFGLCSTPFDLNTDPRFLYLSPEHARARAYLDYAVYKGDSLVVITGEIGIGKSTLVHDLIDRIDKNSEVVVMHHPHANTVEFLQAMLLAWGHKHPAASKPELLSQIRAELEARFTWDTRTTLIVDEAQTLTREVLEELRLLADQEIDSEKPLGIVLIGQPCLNTTLAGREMEQLRQRIRLSFHLSALNEHETKGYIERRLGIAGAGRYPIFLNETISRIHKYTGGVPRLINVLADLSLTAAWMDDTKFVSSKQVNEAIKELGWVPYSRRLRHMSTLPLVENWGGRFRLANDRASQSVQSVAKLAALKAKRVLAAFIASVVRAKEITWTPLAKWVQHRVLPGTRDKIASSRLALQSTRRQLVFSVKESSHRGVQSLRQRSADDDWFSPTTIRGVTIGFAAAMVVGLIVSPLSHNMQPAALAGQPVNSAAAEITPSPPLPTLRLASLELSAAGEGPFIPSTTESAFAANSNHDNSAGSALLPESSNLSLGAYSQEKNNWLPRYASSAVTTLLPGQLPLARNAESRGEQVDALLSGLQPKEWVLAQSPDTYIIQILAAKKREVVDRFLQGEVANLDIAYYRKLRDHEEWYVLVSGIYNSYDSAKLASLTLPEQARKAKPWIRPIADVQQDILQAQSVKMVNTAM